MTVDEMGSIHKERVSISGQQVVTVVKEIDLANLSDQARTLQQLLASWDGDMQPGAHSQCTHQSARTFNGHSSIPSVG